MDTLTIHHLKKRFGDKEVLRDLSLSVPKGSIFGFIGKNGAGKTTAMKIILGLLPRDGGEITVNEKPVVYGRTETNRCIGYLPDVPEFYPFMTAREQLTYCGEIAGMSSSAIRARCDELLSLVGLAQETHHIKGFSRGMKQRLGIAQALFKSPKLLLCDEPTSALDPVGRKEILDILLSIKDETTVLFSTHILADVERICTDVALLDGGKAVIQGPISTVKSVSGEKYRLLPERSEDLPRLRRAFPLFKEENGVLVFSEKEAPLPSVLRFLAMEEIPLLKLEREERTLESLFTEVSSS